MIRFKKCPQLPGAQRTREWHHYGSDMPTSPRVIYVLKSANGPNIFGGSLCTCYVQFKLKVKCGVHCTYVLFGAQVEARDH